MLTRSMSMLTLQVNMALVISGLTHQKARIFAYCIFQPRMDANKREFKFEFSSASIAFIRGSYRDVSLNATIFF